MKGVLFLGNRQAVVKEFPDPEPRHGEVLVRMKASAICGSDMHAYRKRPEEMSPHELAIIPGHEPCGTVEELGEGVENVKKGDRVMLYQVAGCGRCSYCLNGDLMLCDNLKAYAWHMNGSDADFIIAPEMNCLKLPDEMNFVEGAVMACVGGTTYEATKKLGVSGRDTVAIFGLGPIGLGSIMMAKATGAIVIGADLVEERLKLAQQMGADHVVDVSRGDPGEAIRSLTAGRGVDIAIDCSGNSVAQKNAMECVRKNGKVGFVGYNPGKLTIEPGPFFINKQGRIIGSFIFKISTYEELTRFIINHKLRLERMVTHRFSIEDAPEAFRVFDKGKTGKVVFVW